MTQTTLKYYTLSQAASLLAPPAATQGEDARNGVGGLRLRDVSGDVTSSVGPLSRDALIGERACLETGGSGRAELYHRGRYLLFIGSASRVEVGPAAPISRLVLPFGTI